MINKDSPSCYDREKSTPASRKNDAARKKTAREHQPPEVKKRHAERMKAAR